MATKATEQEKCRKSPRLLWAACPLCLLYRRAEQRTPCGKGLGGRLDPESQRGP